MLPEVTKINDNIIGILEGVGVMPTIKTVGPYYPKLVKEFVCNMAEDIDDPTSPTFQKEDIVTAEDVEGPAPGFIAISPKMMQGTHVADIPLQSKDASGTSSGRNKETTRFLRDEIRHLDRVI
ncbi:hypothetical protein LIER_31495 [Lithospermum erythrorhizon]|uniref:Uncharacterized protein n=1 Tax=Lithospermum erythrorhizon TaxID=34254 RepID=A0AAV3RS65_LITER